MPYGTFELGVQFDIILYTSHEIVSRFYLSPEKQSLFALSITTYNNPDTYSVAGPF